MVTINWPALSQSQWSNFLSHVVNEFILGRQLNNKSIVGNFSLKYDCKSLHSDQNNGWL